MKKHGLIMLVLCALPLIGCASITDNLTPASIPDDALTYAQVTNAPKTGMFGLYTCKTDLLAVKELVNTTRQRAVLQFQQLAELDQLNYTIATDTAGRALQQANAIQNQYIDPAFNAGVAGLTGLLGLGAGGMFIRRKGDMPRAEAEEKIKAAGLQDPEQFKQTILSG